MKTISWKYEDYSNSFETTVVVSPTPHFFLRHSYKRWRHRGWSPICWFIPQMEWQPGTPSWYPMWVAGNQTLGAPPAAFPGTSAESWSSAARAPTSVYNRRSVLQVVALSPHCNTSRLLLIILTFTEWVIMEHKVFNILKNYLILKVSPLTDPAKSSTFLIIPNKTV